METLAQTEAASPDTDQGIHLLPARNRADDWPRWRKAAAVSVAAHAVLIVALLLMPSENVTEPVYESKPITVVTPIFTPSDLTQKEPNKGKLSKELSVEAVEPRPLPRAPSTPPPPKRIPASALLPPPPPQVARSEPKVVTVEAPKIQEQSPNIQLPDQLAKLTSPVPPPPPAPKQGITFEDAGPGHETKIQGNPQAHVAMPDSSLEAAVRDLSKAGPLSSQSVDDLGMEDRGIGFGLNLPPSAGRQAANMELRSDPMGVDFRPYMRQILFAIRKNWLAVYPEAARLGQRGTTVLEFRVAKQGLVAKVIFSGESGNKALDQAAVAAISASNPLPPLPTGFKGDKIDLRLTFKYNMPK